MEPYSSNSLNGGFRFAFVSNSFHIASLARSYAASRGIFLEVKLASMEEALPVARELLEEGVDVIFGSGGTGKLLCRHLQRPVVTIEYSHLDIIQALMRARESSSHIAFTCYGLIPPWTALFADLLHVRLTPVPFTNTRELVAGIGEAIDRGAGCVVGGGVGVEIAKARNCPGVVIEPGEESLEKAFDEALQIARSSRSEREKSLWLENMLDCLREGIVSVEKASGKVTSNSAARIIAQNSGLPINSSFIEKLGIKEVLETGKGEDGALCEIGGSKLIIRTSALGEGDNIQGAIAVFEPYSSLRDYRRKLRDQERKGLRARYTLDDLVGNSPAMEALKRKAARYAKSSASLHIYGESGTGKELLAHAIHHASPRANGPFVAINCGALPESLLESELFGYEEGAFTGAKKGGKPGMFELAHGGTIFLDEIADISPAVQVRLLRVLETGEIFRLGGDRPLRVNARVISSSWKNLARETRDGRFRADLYYRLALLTLHTPALRERPGDIPLIARHMLEKSGYGRLSLPREAENMLCGSQWPGNARELDALLRRFCLLNESDAFDEKLFRKLFDEMIYTQNELAGAVKKEIDAETAPVKADMANTSLRKRLDELEREIIAEELRICSHNRHMAAKRLGISVNTLWRKTRNM